MYAWALEMAIEISGFESNSVEIEWPPRSGKKICIPEVDDWRWFNSKDAKQHINLAQAAFIVEIEQTFT